MKHIRISVLAAAMLLSGFMSVSADSGSFKKMIKAAQDAVVLVINYDKDGREAATATGFFINSNGHIVTNVHAVETAEEVGIKTKDGKYFKLKKIINSDEVADLFVFTVEGISSSPNYLKLSAKRLETGDSVTVIGNPLGLEHTVSTGIVSAIREEDDKENKDFLYQISAPISPGSSGSPVLDSAGNVFGIAVMQYKEGQNLNFVVPAYKLTALMSKNANITFKQWTEKGYCFYPSNKFSMVSQGYRLMRKNKNDEAVRMGVTAVKTYPKYAPAYVMYSYALLENDKEEDALKYMKYAIKLEPKRKSIYNDLGGVYQYMEMYDMAAHAYYADIKNTPDSEYPYYNLAVVYLKNDMTEDAIAILNRGIEKAKNPSDLYVKMGQIYISQGDKRLAMSNLRKSVQYDRYNSDAYYMMGAIAVEDSDKASAMDAYNALKAIGSSKAKRLRQMIDAI